MIVKHRRPRREYRFCYTLNLPPLGAQPATSLLRNGEGGSSASSIDARVPRAPRWCLWTVQQVETRKALSINTTCSSLLHRADVLGWVSLKGPSSLFPSSSRSSLASLIPHACLSRIHEAAIPSCISIPPPEDPRVPEGGSVGALSLPFPLSTAFFLLWLLFIVAFSWISLFLQ